MNKREITIEIIVFLFILLFVYASATKLMDYEKFRIQIGQSPMLTSFSALIAWLVPVMELVVALLLVIPRFRLFALYASFTLMVMFTAYIVAVLNFSSRIPCSCGGVLEKLGWTEHLIFNAVFILMSLVAIFLLTLEKSVAPKITSK